MLPISIETATIGAIVAADDRTAKVCEARGIDFCCDGKIPLGMAYARNGLDLAFIGRELEVVQNEPGFRSDNHGRLVALVPRRLHRQHPPRVSQRE